MPPSLEGPLRWSGSPDSDLCLTVESNEGRSRVHLAPCAEMSEGHRQRFRVPPGGQDALCAGGLALASSGAGAPLMARAAALSALALHSQETDIGYNGGPSTSGCPRAGGTRWKTCRRILGHVTLAYFRATWPCADEPSGPRCPCRDWHVRL